MQEDEALQIVTLLKEWPSMTTELLIIMLKTDRNISFGIVLNKKTVINENENIVKSQMFTNYSIETVSGLFFLFFC